jgi:hypothetical protein
MNDPKPLVAYYMRAGYYRQAVALCEDSLKRRGNDAYFVYWKAYALACEGLFRIGLCTDKCRPTCQVHTRSGAGNFSGAIRDAEGLRGKRDTEYAALVALRHFHAASKLVDKDALAGVCRVGG